MQVHFIDSGTGQDLGFKEVNVHSFKMDSNDAPYAIVSNPFFPNDSLRAEYNFYNDCLQWVVDIS
jgi:hypothetical protein